MINIYIYSFFSSEMKATVVSLLYIIVIKPGKESNSIQDPSHGLNILTRDKLVD
jgi:hypothetical protein